MLYSIFAVATALVVLFYLWIPIVKEVVKSDPVPDIVKGFNKYLLYMVLIILSILIAPLLFIIWFVPAYKEQFHDSLVADLKQS